ncbi:MAG: glycoside hydrolase family 2 protein [Clostridia bacterium]|nr:glycoside hydrolase family 2 protein [Clostridia bacterium]
MRKILNLNKNWTFEMNGVQTDLDIPHTWNGVDGQNGGNNYKRTVCSYKKTFARPDFNLGEEVYLEFCGVNSSCEVFFGGQKVCSHDGGYSKFRVCVTSLIQDENELIVKVDNRANETVYPQTADFTFYGGIYRDVNLIVVNANHFDLDYHGAPGIMVTPTVEGNDGKVEVKAFVTGKGDVKVSILDDSGNVVASGNNGEMLTVTDARLWNGVIDPYLYTAKAELVCGGVVVDEVSANFGFRTFKIDPDKGFFLNGKSYPLRGVCRHQDRPKIGNAITKEMHEEDMSLIVEVGATTIRLAHYQHDDYFYDLCDKYGMVVWAEIPYISRHMNGADENAMSQMKELISQQYNHPSIVCWGLSNEITMHPAGEDRLDFHKKLNDFCHKFDPTRPTVIAVYMVAMVRNKLNYVPDLVSYNLYHGWYLPFFSLSGKKLDRFHKVHPTTPLGLSEYGAEAMPNLHSVKPKRGDNTEEFQCIFHEKYLDIIEERDYLWATHVWNMYDFAADARNQGGEPGMNHKGLVTFDRKTKKDAFYLYKAHWSKDPFIHVCGKRFVNRTGDTALVKVYSNQNEVELFVDGKSVGKKTGKYKFEFNVPFGKNTKIEAKSGDLSDESVINKVSSPDPAYKLTRKNKGSNKSWEK